MTTAAPGGRAAARSSPDEVRRETDAKLEVERAVADHGITAKTPAGTEEAIEDARATDRIIAELEDEVRDATRTPEVPIGMGDRAVERTIEEQHATVERTAQRAPAMPEVREAAHAAIDRTGALVTRGARAEPRERRDRAGQ